MDKFKSYSLEKREYKTKSGSISIRWRAVFPYKEDGKWRKKSIALKTTGRDKGRSKKVIKAAEAEAEAIRQRLNAEEERRALGALEESETPNQWTVASYLDSYIAEASISVEPSTVDGYRYLARGVIGTYLAEVPISDMKPEHVSKWMRDALKDYSVSSVRKGFVLLRAALRQACDRGLIPNDKDPTRGLKAPRQSSPVSNSLKEADRGAVLAYVNIKPTLPVSVAVRLALYTGMRRAEMCALRWRNVDIEGCTLRVAQSFGKASKKDVELFHVNPLCFSGLYLKDPKNKSSIRTVCYPQDMANAFKARKARMKEDCISQGIPFSEDMFVLGTIESYETTRNGNPAIDYVPMHPKTLWSRWHAIAEDLELVGTEGKIPTLHDLRHTYATTAVANNIDVKTISSSMGHTNAAMTLNRYASADPDAKKRAAETMGAAYAVCVEQTKAVAEVLELGKTGTED